MNKLILPFLALITVSLCGCTMSVTTIHTQGSASDVVDETQVPSTQVNPDIDIPIAPLK